MTRVDATHARWTFTAPLESIQDTSGFEVNGHNSLSAAWVSGSAEVLATYTGPVVVGQAWAIAGDVVEFPGAVPSSPQVGSVT